MKTKIKAFVYDCEDENFYVCGKCNLVVNTDEMYCQCCGVELNWSAVIPILLKDLPEQESD